MKGGTAGFLVSATAVFYSDWINVVATGTKFAQDTFFGFGEVSPNVYAFGVSHNSNHTTGDGEGVFAKGSKFFFGGVDVSYIFLGELYL